MHKNVNKGPTTTRPMLSGLISGAQGGSLRPRAGEQQGQCAGIGNKCVN